MQKEESQTVELRSQIAKAKRIVIKLGSRVLVTEQGEPELDRMQELVKEIAALRKEGKEVVVVSSGAVGSGMGAMGITKKPKGLPDLQMVAAVGQNKLMARYDKMFAKEGCLIGQILLTHDVLKDRERHLNTRNTFMALLRNGIIPVVNENDTVSVDELKFGDNDMLASLVTMLIEADVMLLLSSTDGLRDMNKKKSTRVPYVKKITADILALAHGKGSAISTGGMRSKLEAADMVVNAGAVAMIADGRMEHVVRRVFSGEDVGTLIGDLSDGAHHKINSKRRWIAFYHRAKGAVTVNSCASKALVERGVSLLPVGVVEVEGDFDAGAVIDIKSQDGEVIGRGLCPYSSNDVKQIMGQHSSQVRAIVGAHYYEEIVHRDNMVVFE